MIHDNTPQFHAQQDELLRQYRCNPRKDIMNATENIAAGALPVSAGDEIDEGPAVMAVRLILRGIDQDEAEHDGGWWETSGGVEFGAKKLAEVVALVRGLEGQLDDARAVAQMNAHAGASWAARVQELEAELASIGAGGVSGPLLAPQADPAGDRPEDVFVKLLAECRDVFPCPPPGDPLEVQWAAAIACPEEVCRATCE